MRIIKKFLSHIVPHVKVHGDTTRTLIVTCEGKRLPFNISIDCVPTKLDGDTIFNRYGGRWPSRWMFKSKNIQLHSTDNIEWSWETFFSRLFLDGEFWSPPNTSILLGSSSQHIKIKYLRSGETVELEVPPGLVFVKPSLLDKVPKEYINGEVWRPEGLDWAIIPVESEPRLNFFGISELGELLCLQANSLDSIPGFPTRYHWNMFSQPCRVGKFLKALGVPTNEIPKVGQLLSAKLDLGQHEVEWHITATPSEIYNLQLNDAGGTLGASCMQGKPASWFTLYDQLESCKLLYATYNGKIVGRALLWEDVQTLDGTSLDGVTLMDRVYSTRPWVEQAFFEKASKEGWWRKARQSYEYKLEMIIPGIKGEVEQELRVPLHGLLPTKVPYLDTFSFIAQEQGKFYLQNAWTKRVIGELSDTDGNYSMRNFEFNDCES